MFQVLIRANLKSKSGLVTLVIRYLALRTPTLGGFKKGALQKISSKTEARD